VATIVGLIAVVTGQRPDARDDESIFAITDRDCIRRNAIGPSGSSHQKGKEQTMSVLQIKTIQKPFTPAQRYIDAKHALSGDVYWLEAGIR
jgi:hypothetical protein